MIEPSAERFWQSAPWVENASGYSLGVYCISQSQWLHNATAADRARKRALIARYPDTVIGLQAGASGLVERFAAYLEAYLNTTEGKTAPLQWQNAPSGMANVASWVADDLCLLSSDAKGVFRLEAACVCAPSYWHLPSKMGGSVGAIHRDVPTLNAKLGQAMTGFFQTLPVGQVVERRNWFVHQSGELFQPAAEEPDPDVWVHGSLSDLWVRCERQTLVKFTSTEMVFTIGVQCRRMSELANHEASTLGMIEALAGKDESERIAFGGTVKCDALVQRLHSLLNNG